MIKELIDKINITLTFPQTLSICKEAGVLYYYNDFINKERVFYGKGGTSIKVKEEGFPTVEVGESFNKEEIINSIRLIQQGKLTYKDWAIEVIKNGCFGYFVFLEGKGVLYLGEKGEQHLETFIK